MKTLITILFLSLLSSPSWSVYIYDFVEREGVYYKKFSDVPFTGEIDGELIKGSMKNGKQEGEWISYSPNGQLRSKGNYKNGKEEGAWVHYWSNGQLDFKGNYKNGKSEGAWVGFEEDGRVKEFMTGTFKNGVKIRKD